MDFHEIEHRYSHQANRATLTRFRKVGSIQPGSTLALDAQLPRIQQHAGQGLSIHDLALVHHLQ